MEKSVTRLWIMCGIPGSGKSTWIQNHKHFFDIHSKIVSRDEIRFSMIKDENKYFSNEKEVYKEFISQIKSSLNENIDTIVDATHISIGSRTKLLNNLKDSLKEVEVNSIVIKTPLKIALERNEGRTGLKYAPPSAIKNMYSQFSIPTLEEGFERIYIYSKKGEKINYNIIERS